jgi:hypothetical protein
MNAPSRVEIAICERHGLRYNAAEGQGCVRCRREAGLATGTVPVTAAPAKAAKPAAPGPRRASAPLHLLIAAALVGGTGALFWSAHRDVVASFGNLAPDESGGVGGEHEADDEAAVPAPLSYAEDGAVEGETAADADPAAYPPEDVAIGPAEQQRQLDELMRQMEEDAAADAESARRGAERARDGG